MLNIVYPKTYGNWNIVFIPESSYLFHCQEVRLRGIGLIQLGLCSVGFKVKVKSLSCVWLFTTPWTVAHQAPPSIGFSRQEYWSGLPFPSPGDLPYPGIEPRSPALWADAGRCFNLWATREAHCWVRIITNLFCLSSPQFSSILNVKLGVVSCVYSISIPLVGLWD